MYKNIILIFYLFSPLYIFTTSLKLVNKSYCKNTYNIVNIINYTSLLISGSVFLYNLKYLSK